MYLMAMLVAIGNNELWDMRHSDIAPSGYSKNKILNFPLNLLFNIVPHSTSFCNLTKQDADDSILLNVNGEFYRYYHKFS